VELRLWVQGDLGVELAVEQLFTTPSIRDLAIAIDQLLGGEASNTVASDTPGPGDGSGASRWVICPQPRPLARSRLICFHYAGGGASAFKDWANSAPDDLELCVVQMPGREERLGEPLITEMPALVDALTEEIMAYTDRPFAFFGHSMGAIVAYEVARRLQSIGGAQPDHLFVSARAAPQLENRSEPLRFLDNDQFIDRLHQTYGAVPEAIRNSTELQAVFLPILRADVELLETYMEADASPLNCPITAFGGASDPAITAAMLAGWQDRTGVGFVQHEFAGDHFFIHAEREAVMAAIVECLSGDK
jgi:surfactin synthase thioesterase subunit